MHLRSSKRRKLEQDKPCQIKTISLEFDSDDCCDDPAPVSTNVKQLRRILAVRTSETEKPASETDCLEGHREVVRKKVSNDLVYDLETNVGPILLPCKLPLARVGVQISQPELQRSHTRVPSVVIDKSFVKETHFYAVLAAFTTLEDPSVQFSIEHGCSSAKEATAFALEQAHKFAANCSGAPGSSSISNPFKILHVPLDYPTTDINTPDDPYLPSSYTGPRPDEDTWAICKDIPGDEIEIRVRYWKFENHGLRALKTISAEINSEWTSDEPPRQVFVAQHRCVTVTEGDNVFPPQFETELQILGIYWAPTGAALACNRHIASKIANPEYVNNACPDFFVRSEDGRQRHTWGVKTFNWDGGFPK